VTWRLGDLETWCVMRGTRRLRVVSGERLVFNGKQFNASTITSFNAFTKKITRGFIWAMLTKLIK